MNNFNYFDYNSKKDVIFNNVYLGYFIESNLISNKNKYDFLDEIYIISLEHRDDRRIKLLENLEYHGFSKVKFFIPRKMSDISKADKQKLNGILFKNMIDIKNYSVLGCFVSHLICHKDAFVNKFNNILILEDDCLLLDISDDYYNQIKNFVLHEKFDALYLHHANNTIIDTHYKADKFIKRNIMKNFDFKRFDIVQKYNNIKIFSGSALTHFIIFSKNFINLMNSYLIDIKKFVCLNYDFVLHKFAYTHNFYTTNNILSSQFESFSDITFSFVNKGF